METAFNMFFFYYDFDINHLVVVFKWYLRTLCVCAWTIFDVLFYLSYSVEHFYCNVNCCELCT